jgi:toxin ParE1/3/4
MKAWRPHTQAQDRPLPKCSHDWKRNLVLKIYKVIIETTAEKDLLDIVRYINDRLYAPEAAKKFYSKAKELIQKLEEHPKRHELIQDEPYRELGVRRIYVDNYVIFYSVNDDAGSVSVFRILYAKVQWQDWI